MAVTAIDLNADLAEECGDDAAMYPFLTSANVCCGEHAGGPDAMREAVSAALAHNVSIGAHVGYADRENFGRDDVEMSYSDLYALTRKQIELLKSIAEPLGATLRYVKPHGALYHRIGRDAQQARAVTDAIADIDSSLQVLVPHTPVILEAAMKRGLYVAHEFFADRAYLPSGTLAPRSMEGSVLHDSEFISNRVMDWLRTGTITATDGSTVTIDAESICLHGDTPGAVDNARTIHDDLVAHGFTLKSWLD